MCPPEKWLFLSNTYQIGNNSNKKLLEYETLWESDWRNILSSYAQIDKVDMLIQHVKKEDQRSLIVEPVNQAGCNSCWAVVTALSLTDRFRIALMDPTFPVLSPSNLMGEAYRRKGML